MVLSRSTNDGKYSKPQMQLLLRIAREAIERRLSGQSNLSRKDLEKSAGKNAAALMQERGAFVTLTINGELRGCIGSIFADAPLLHTVYDNALNAAFSDSRFMPLSKNEFGKIAIEVSVLSPIFPLDYSDAPDLLSKLKPHEHGVLLRFSNGAGSTFLPQVWEQLPQKEEFLSHLCAKAGMRPDSWRTLHPKVSVYSVQSAEERG